MNTNKKLDNKGFSLVELIIVIAIMAILVGVVGTQVIPYIEKSRRSKDQQVLSGYCTDMVAAGSTCATKLNPTATYTATITSTGTVTVTSSVATDTDGPAALEAELKNLRGNDASFKWESKAATEATTGNIILTYTQSGNTGCVARIDGIAANTVEPVSSK